MSKDGLVHGRIACVDKHTFSLHETIPITTLHTYIKHTIHYNPFFLPTIVLREANGIRICNQNTIQASSARS